ncbi:MAG: methyltransferase family protein [Terriglobales bacterium]
MKPWHSGAPPYRARNPLSRPRHITLGHAGGWPQTRLTGLLVANLGAALFIGKWRCLAAVAIFLVEISRKALQEEKVMLSAFGDQYAEYRHRSGFLIPRF